jgi:response regulator of citrate/malate metabolism
MIQVMIIEDDPMVREINTKFLQKVEGFELIKAASCLSEAQSFAFTQKPNLILLDIYLPRENGIDFLKWLRKEEIKADVILITADKTIDRVQEAFRYGAVDYLIKPFTFERFKEALIKYKDRFYNFKKVNEIEQDELDRYVLNNKDLVEEDSRGMDLTKGLNPYTYRMIWQQVEKMVGEDITAEELAEKLRIARVTVRKYLDYMDKEGKVQKLIEYGKIGRPQHKYRIKN